MKFFVLEKKVGFQWQAAEEEVMCVHADDQGTAETILLEQFATDELRHFRVREYVRAK